MPWQELEEEYALAFSPTAGAPAKSVRLAFGALYIKQRLGLSDEETVRQIQEIAYMQFFLGFSGYRSDAPFDPSMMVHFRKRLPDDLLRRTNELIGHAPSQSLRSNLPAMQGERDAPDATGP